MQRKHPVALKRLDRFQNRQTQLRAGISFRQICDYGFLSRLSRALNKSRFHFQILRADLKTVQSLDNHQTNRLEGWIP